MASRWRYVVGFASLFWGRSDAWFQSYRSPVSGRAGRCVHGQVSVGLFAAHLLGSREIGTYPVLDDSSCRWGCIDIDEDDYDLALSVQAVWRYFGITSWIECSRSKGYHVWVFGRDWSSAQTWRRAGLFVADIVGDRRLKEVNPKAEAPWFTLNGLVNTVRLPYSGRAKPGRMVVLSDGEALSAEDFTARALASRASTAALSAVAARYRPPEPVFGPSSGDGSGGPLRGSQEALAAARGERLIGAGERDNQFFTLARALRAMETPLDEAQAIVERTYRDQVTDTYGFSLEDALSKLRRAYGGWR